MSSRMSVLLALILLAFSSSFVTAQLFPFSSLRTYIDQQHSESAQQTTHAPPPVDKYRFMHEEESHQVPTPSPGTQPTERTVIVTPKTKYIPQRVVKEPKEDPNSPNVPSIGVTSEIIQKIKANKKQLPLTAAKPVVHLVTVGKTDPPSKKVNFLPTLEPIIKEYFTQTIVDTVPSLSLTIPLESVKNSTKDGLVDYLIPPKFPSVYESHMRGTNFPGDQKSSVESNVLQDPFKSKKKKKSKINGKRDSTIADSENRIRLRNRPKGPKETIEWQETKSPVTKPRRVRPHHPLEEQVASETHFGLGGHEQGERVEFQLHGQNGPESYKFGYDTGKGKNRQFRYEEKDPHGNVKGHYGFYDKSGKLQIVNYHADKGGFHASSS